MIKIDINIKDRILKKINVEGHSGFSIKGNDIVCSAVSILVYSTYLSLVNIPIVKIKVADNSKKYLLKILKIEDKIIGELRGITIFLISGLKSIEKDYPKNIVLNIEEK